MVFVEHAAGVGVTLFPYIYPWTDRGSDEEEHDISSEDNIQG